MRGGKREGAGRKFTGRESKVWRIPIEYKEPIKSLVELEEIKELIEIYKENSKKTRDWTKFNEFIKELETN